MDVVLPEAGKGKTTEEYLIELEKKLLAALEFPVAAGEAALHDTAAPSLLLLARGLNAYRWTLARLGRTPFPYRVW